MRKGTLIVLEGLDASGKRTQARMLAAELKRRGKKVRLLSFPAYGTPYGKLVEMYLSGKMGGREGIPPKTAATLFALDRLQFRGRIEEMLAGGTAVVADRYVESNLYQAARVPDGKRKLFIAWLEKLEEGMPAAGIVVVLDVPVGASRTLLRKRGRREDVNEKDAEYLGKVRKVYLSEAKRRGWKVINCVDGKGRLKAKAEIAAEIWKAVNSER